MFKPRNVIIILILTIVIISVFSAFSELFLLGNAASTADTYVRIAAEAALRSAVVSDEFFTSGTTSTESYVTGIKSLSGDGAFGSGYNLADSGAALNVNAMSRSGLLVEDGTGSFKADSNATNIYVRTYGGMSTSSSLNVDGFRDQTFQIFNSMYRDNSSFKLWAANLLQYYFDRNPNDNNYPMIASRKVYWTDSDFATGEVYSGYASLPRLLTMGVDLFRQAGVVSLSDITAALKESNVLTYTSAGSSGLPSLLGDQRFYGDIPGVQSMERRLGSEGFLTSDLDPDTLLMKLLNSVDYWDYRRISTVAEDRSSGLFELQKQYDESSAVEADFYYTPLSIGLTYIDPYILGNLFTANMDLLMRAKYINPTTGALSDYEAEPTFSYYPVDDPGFTNHGYPSGWGTYVVNNGSFFYLRGRYEVPDSTTPGHYVGFNGSAIGTPEIEYLYIPIYATKTYNETTKKNELASDGNAALLDADVNLRRILARAIDPVITFSDLLKDSTEAEVLPNGMSLYELVVAKVTFTADFLYPFKNGSTRGMAQHFNSQTTDAVTRTIRGMQVSDWATQSVIDALPDMEDPATATTIKADLLSDQVLTGFNDAIPGTNMNYYQYRYTRYFAVRN